MPAKASILKIKQYNGRFGCIACFHPGRREGASNTYPYDKDYRLKKNKHYVKYSKLADEININKDKSKLESIFGFFGSTSMDKLLIIPNQIPFDYMHLVLQGHSRWLLGRIFTDKAVDDIYLGKNSDLLNKLLIRTKLPHTMSRKPQDVNELLRWKSSEIKIFVLYLAVPIFLNLLPSWYFYRFCSYVFFVRTLYEEINDKDLALCDEVIKKYIKDLEDTFTSSALTYTIHAHLHLIEQVKNHGPLYCHSQFFFEGALNNLKNLLHGTRGFINQITKQIFHLKDIKFKIEKQDFKNDELYSFTMKTYSFNLNENSLIGSVDKRKATNNEKEIFINCFNHKIEMLLVGYRIKMKNKIYHSKSYTRRGNTNSFTISYLKNNEKRYGDIEFFYDVNDTIYAYVSKYEIKKNISDLLPKSSGYFYDVVKDHFFKKFYKIIENTENVENEIIPCESILNRCIIIKSSNNLSFITELAYEFEHD